MRVALLSCNARIGDAIGNQLAEKVAFFRERGAEVRVFLQDPRRVSPAVRPFCTPVPELPLTADAWHYVASSDLFIADYSQHYALLGLLPLLVGAKPRLVFDYHGVTPPRLWDVPAQREALEQGVRQRGLVWCADAALVHSGFAAQELREQTDFPTAWIHHLGYPLDLQRFSSRMPAHQFRKRLGVRAATLLLFVGRLAPNKRTPLLVEALARLRDRTPPVHAVLLGDCGDVYQLEAARCRQRAAELGVTDRLHLLGHVRDELLADAYRSADVFVMPSIHEGFCLPVLEALACGVPVVAARAGALPETVGDAGLLFAPDDVTDLVLRLEELLSADPPEAEARRRKGLERAAGHNRTNWREQFGRVLENVLHAPPRPHRRRVVVRPRTATRTVSNRLDVLPLTVEVANQGTHALVPEGPARVRLRCEVHAGAGRRCTPPAVDAALPDVLLPGRTLTVAVPVPVPGASGSYQVHVWAEQDDPAPERAVPSAAVSSGRLSTTVRLIVEEAASRASRAGCTARLDAAHSALAAAHHRQRLPDQYVDVTEGRFATWKRWLKRKLLGNFQQGYVDVLSRQQSAFNEHVLAALGELSDCCATLDRTVEDEQVVPVALHSALTVLRNRLDELEDRLERLERLETENLFQKPLAPLGRGVGGEGA